MDSKQLVDSLADHMALFHRAMAKNHIKSQFRSNVIQWMKSLTTPQRQAALTIVDEAWIALLLQMNRRLRKDGAGFFIILPDMVDRTQAVKNLELPSVCYRKARGLLARVSAADEAEKSLIDSVRLFSSGESQNLLEFSAFDALVLTETFVSDVDKFVSVMDNVSTGEFLRSSNPSGSQWEEMPWLKARGYYSLAAFVANRLEICIGLSWLNSRGKKNGARLAAGSSRNLAMSTFWRKKGVIDWWCNLPVDTKAGALKLAIARAARLEAHQSGLQMGREVAFADSRFPRSYVRNTSKIFIRDDNDMCYSYFKYPRGQFCKNPLFEVLYNLQDISPLTLLDIVLIPESDRLFLSTLHCVDTVADKIIRRVRELIAKVSKDSLELDLLREDLQDPIHCPIDKGVQIQKKEKRRKGRKTKKKNLTNDKLTEKDSLKQTACKESLQFKMHKGEIDSCRNNSEPLPQREILILEINDGQVNHTSNRKRRSKSKKKLSKDAGDASLLRRNGSISEYLNDEFHEKPASCHEPGAVCSKDQILENRCHAMHEKEFSCAEISCGFSAENAKMSCNVNGNVSGEKHKMTCSTEQVSKGPLINSNSCDILESSINKCPPETTETVLNSVKLPCKALEALPFESNECSAGRDSLSIKGSNLSLDHRTSILVESMSDIDCDAKQAGRVTLSSSEMPHKNTKVEAGYEGLNASINYTKPNADKMTTPGPLASPLSKTREGFQSKECSNTQLCYAAHDPNNVFLPMSYEWPGALSFRVPMASNRVLPAATDRLHLDVDWNYYRPQGSFVALKQHWHRHSLCHGGYNQGAVISPPLKNFEWSKVHSGCGIQPSLCCSVDRGPTPIYRPSYIPVNIDPKTNANLKNDLKHDVTDDMSCDEGNDLCGNADDIENFAVSEDETEKVFYKNPSNFDYNKVFGGGVMYWNTADYPGSGYSRPPSLSSEDSSWARHEDDLKLAIDDIVSLPQISSPYGNSGVSSPTKTFCSPCDQYNSSTPASHPSFAKASNDISGNFLSPSGPSILEEKESKSIISSDFKHVDGCKGDMLSHPILRPIVIPNMTRQKSRTDVKNTLESRSSCMSSGQKEPSRLNRPPSPMVLCVPSHPLSPVRGFRKQRRFPAVRSGSSSPRQWVINSWFSETETDIDENCFTATHPELAGVSRRNKYITGTPPMPTPRGSLVDGRLIKIPNLPLEHEHPDIGLPLQSPEIEKNSSLQTSVVKLQNILHEEIECFCKQITSANQGRKLFINAAVDKVSRALQVLWPRSRTRVFGSIATGLALPTSDVDLVVCLPPVRNLEPIKEAGILEGRNGIKETCLQHAARYLADQEWVETDSLKTVENTTIPIIMLVVRVPSNMSDTNIDAAATHTLRKEFSKENGEGNLISDLGKISVHDSAQINDSESGNLLQDLRNNFEFVRLDISFESVSHTGLKTASLVRELTGLFPALMPLAQVLKQFLTDRCLDHPYSGGLSSYCLVLLLTRFLQHQHHSGRSINQNLGSLLMDFLYFFGCVFDPRQMRVSIYGSGMYVNRGRGQSIDPLHIDDPLDDPLHPIKNVGRNCFRIHQCIKAFADAHSTLEKELHLLDSPDLDSSFDSWILPKIIPSIFHHDKDQR